MNKISIHKLLLCLPLLLIGLVGCKGEDEPTPTDRKVSIEVTMPDPLSLEGVKGSMAYYWNKELTLHLLLTQEGKKSMPITLRPEVIPGEGDKVRFDVTVPHDRFDTTRPITVTGSVVSGKETRAVAPMTIPVGGGQAIKPKGFGGLLPYDLLKEIHQPLFIQPVTITPDEEKVSPVKLEPKGQLLFLQFHNGTDEAVALNTLTLKSADGTLFGTDAFYDPATGEMRGTRGDSSPSLPLDKQEMLSPDLVAAYLVWLPSEKLPKATYRLSHLTEDGKEVISEGETPTDLDKSLSLSYLGMKEDGTLGVSDEPVIEEADISEGGDPLFTMNDIEFWVGEGEKRAALVIEWHDDKQPDAMVWGYRFDGDKTGYDMMMAVVEADPRLSLLLGKAFGGLDVIFGMGYQFTPTTPRAPIILDGQKLSNNGNGITFVENAKDADKYKFGDESGHWKEGWYKNGYWVYYVKDNRLDSFSYSQLVYSLRHLVDGCWDGWSFQDGMDSYVGRPHGNKFVPAPLPNKK